MDEVIGQEGNIKYIISPQGRKIYLTVENVVTNNKDEFTYECQYPCLFGYDCMDTQLVNEKLDGMIENIK